jgi:hypothetical protein
METNKPTFELHKLKEGFIVSSNEEIKENDYVIEDIGGTIYGPIDRESIVENPKKVIVQQDQIDFSGLLEEEQKEIGWFDVEKLYPTKSIEKQSPYTAFNNQLRQQGFQKAQELLSDRRFTENELIEAIIMAQEYTQGHGHVYNSSEIIQSISQKSWKVELEMEFCPQALPKDRYTPKLTNAKIKILKLLS